MKFLSSASPRLKMALNLNNLITLALVCSLGLNLVLTSRVKSAESFVANLKAQAANQLRVGSAVPPVQFLDKGGQLETVDFAQSHLPTILYAMLPTCKFCEYNLANLQALIRQADGRYRVVVLSMDAAKVDEYSKMHGFEVGVLSQQGKRDLQIGGTPTTFLVSPDGRLAGLWSGAFDTEQRRDIEKVLSVHLPGLTGPVESRH